LAASVRLCVCTKSRILLVGNRYNLVGICLMLNARSDWKLMTVELDSIFVPTQAITFEWRDLARPSSVWRYALRMSVSRSSFKVIKPRSRLRQLRQQRAGLCSSRIKFI